MKKKKHSNAIMHVINFGLAFVLGAALLFQVSVLILRLENPEKIFWVAGYCNLIVNSGSMEDAIQVDDMIIVKQDTNYTENDIVTFWQHGMLVTHRIIAVTDEGFITKGDANNTCDEEITRAQVEGKVVKIIPQVGSIIRILHSPYCIVLLLFSSILLVYFDMSNKLQEKENGQRNQRL